VELRYDAELGVYLVVGVRDLYYLDAVYYRLEGDRWSVGSRAGGPWKVVERGKVPPGLRSKHRHKHKDKHRGHGRPAV
jgi:hypothetical protein